MRTVLAAAALVAVAATVAFVPLEFADSVSMPGRVYPAREWMLIREGDGSVGSLLRDHVDGIVEAYGINRFERGDVVRFSMNPALRPPARVSAGDTVGTIVSNETERQLAQLSAELASTVASQRLYGSGEKAPVVAEIQSRLSRAEELARQHEKILDRLRVLRQRDLVSQQDLEVAQSQMEIYEADIAIARAQLEAVQTGAKPEQLELVQTEAAGIRKQIETLKSRLDQMTLTTPLSGVVVRIPAGDTLLAIRDTSAFVAIMPVRLADVGSLRPGQEVDIRVDPLTTRLSGRLEGFDQTVHMLGGEQVLFATVSLPERTPGIIPGAYARCTFSRGTVTPRGYVSRIVGSVFSH